MADDKMMKPDDRDAVLAAVTAKNPDAFITAIGINGLFTPMPPAVAALGLRTVEGPSSMLALVVPEDQRLLLDTWHQVVTEGVAGCRVHLTAAPDEQARLHFIDGTHRFGVYLGIIIGTGITADLALTPEEYRPRLVTMVKNQVSVVTEVGPEITALLGYAPADLIGRRTLDLVHPGDQDRAITGWLDMLGSPPGATRRVRLRHLHRDGHTVWFEVTNHNLLAEPDNPRVIAEMLDISDEMAAQEAVRSAEKLMRRLTETIPLAIVQVAADGRIT
ncbi:MAG TPA: PAS domain S-box protein, partial [Actinoplanes sp.]|nr:PAS domain S-box protein [Actinoplanes sp.]